METAHPLRDMSAEISTIDDADSRGDAVAGAALKFRLPPFPPGRAETDVKRWYKGTIAALNAHRLAHVLRKCAKELADMTDKEFSDNQLVCQALYDCLSSDGERRRLREQLGSDAEHDVPKYVKVVQVVGWICHAKVCVSTDSVVPS